VKHEFHGLHEFHLSKNLIRGISEISVIESYVKTLINLRRICPEVSDIKDNLRRLQYLKSKHKFHGFHELDKF
jgi:hypothetical protein